MPQTTTLQRGSTDKAIPARVVRVTPAGVIVALPDGRQGLVREREIAWDADARRSWRERYAVGTVVQVIQLPKDGHERPEFSIRLAQDDPWLDIEEKYVVGGLVNGVVTGITAYGIFVELEPGVTGLVHTSRFPAWVSGAPSEHFWPGDWVKVVVGEINAVNREMALHLAERARWRWREIDDPQKRKRAFVEDNDSLAISRRQKASDLLVHSAKSILVVDDALAVRNEVSEWLSHAGHRVTLAATGAAALDAVSNNLPEIVLVDVHLPDMSGLEVAQTIQAEWPEVRCILMSGDHSLAEESEDLMKLHERGVPFLYKPFRPDELLQHVFAPPAPHTNGSKDVKQESIKANFAASQSHLQLNALLRQVWRATKVNLAVLFEVDTAQRTVRVIEQFGRPLLKTTPLPGLVHSPVRDAAEDNQIVRAADVYEANTRRFRHLTPQIRFTSCLGVPVAVTLPNRYALFLFSDKVDVAVSESAQSFAGAAALAAAAWLERDAFARQAAELQRLVLLGQLGRTLVHEINNQAQNIPWAVEKIPAYVEQAKQLGLSDPERMQSILKEAQEILHEASIEVELLASIAKPFTSLTRLEHETSLFLDITVEEVVRVMQDTAQRANVTITAQDLTPMAFIRGQDTELHQILVNILLNAVQQVEQSRDRAGGRVMVRLTATQHNDQPIFRIEVEDDGPGIHRRLWERIFEMGYTTRPGGSGVGLSVARTLIENMAGRIVIAESWLGWGSTFVVEIPR
ncbi:MAG: response regulator [Anaerolineae bacterium]